MQFPDSLTVYPGLIEFFVVFPGQSLSHHKPVRYKRLNPPDRRMDRNPGLGPDPTLIGLVSDQTCFPLASGRHLLQIAFFNLEETRRGLSPLIGLVGPIHGQATRPTPAWSPTVTSSKLRLSIWGRLGGGLQPNLTPIPSPREVKHTESIWVKIFPTTTSPKTHPPIK